MSVTHITNTYIVDGTGQKGYQGHVVIRQGHIDKIIKSDEPRAIIAEGDVIIDGQGFVLSPGFIDTHSHSDLEILKGKGLEPKIRQGITTEILGQDGISMAPLPQRYIDDWRKNIAGLDGVSDDLNWHYESVDGYFDLIENTPLSNHVAYLLPHGNVRLAAMGFREEDPSASELEQMKTIVREAMISGCIGLSSGLIYHPCNYAKEEELIELCKIVHEFQGIFVVHQRSEANQILSSMDEIIRIGRASKVRIHFSHFKICGKRNWHLIDKVLAKLDEAKAYGLEVSFDMYPYTAGSTMLSAILPPWMHVGGTGQMIRRLEDFAIRKMLKKELKKKHATWDNFVEFAGVNGIYITSTASDKNQEVIGKNLSQIGELRNQPPLDAAFDLLIEEKNHVGMIDYYGYEEHLKTFVQRDEMNGCTDGLLGGKPHPRAYGAFARFISEYVENDEIISLEEMVHKLTQKPAEVFRLKDRGVIRVGAMADLVLFDVHHFKDTGTYIKPMSFPTGLKMVMVQGIIVFDGEKVTQNYPGQLIRKQLV